MNRCSSFRVCFFAPVALAFTNICAPPIIFSCGCCRWATAEPSLIQILRFSAIYHPRRAHVQHEFRKLRSANRVSVRLRSVGDWYEADPGSRLFKLAERAVEKQWGRPPLYVREGGTMPVSKECRPSACLTSSKMYPSMFKLVERAVEKQWGRPLLYAHEGGTMLVRRHEWIAQNGF